MKKTTVYVAISWQQHFQCLQALRLIPLGLYIGGQVWDARSLMVSLGESGNQVPTLTLQR